MRFSAKKLGLVLCCCVLFISRSAFCDVRLPRLVSDGMVLQRGSGTKVWGWADAGEKVTIKFSGKTYAVAAGGDGKWQVKLSKMKAGGPYTMEIEAANRITLKNILVGDVWVCSGQSNMVLPMKRVSPLYGDVIAASENDSIRQFLVPMKYDFKSPQQDLKSGHWESANPQTVLYFTATGYFFAKALYEKYGVPIGLINASIGGSPAEAWMSEEALKEFPEHLNTARKFKSDEYIEQIRSKERDTSDAWYRLIRERDRGLAAGKKRWYDPAYDYSDWPTMSLPGYWADGRLGHVNGVVWFRRDFIVPDSMAGKPAKLLMGTIVDSDEIYINGRLVGTTSYQYPPRRYDVPADLLKAGRNTIVARVVNTSGRGGFVKNKPYQLSVEGWTIDLKGRWRYKLGAIMDPLPPTTFIQYKPLGLYNGMIAPLLNCAVKGVIWYQGESNTGRGLEYRKLFPALITDWRKNWNRGKFPFLYVQLANFMKAKAQPSESGWAELREAQLKTLAVPNTAMAVTIDIGEWNDIHPLNKKDVGERLALAARKLAYGDRRLVHSGPIYKSVKIKDGKAVISFTNTGGGLVAKGGELKQFAIAGRDKKPVVSLSNPFVWANAKIKGKKVIVWSDKVTDPVAVRYAWADNPEGANLYNKQGLPASPFRTDD